MFSYLLVYASLSSFCLSVNLSIHPLIRCQGEFILYLTGAPSLFLDSAPLTPSRNLFCIESNPFKVHSLLGVVLPTLPLPCSPLPSPAILPHPCSSPSHPSLPIHALSCPLPVLPLPYLSLLSFPFPLPLQPPSSTLPCRPPFALYPTLPCPPQPSLVLPLPFPTYPCVPCPPPLPNFLTCCSPLPVITCYRVVAPRSAYRPAPTQHRNTASYTHHPPGRSQHLSRISIILLTLLLLISRLSLSLQTILRLLLQS